MLLADANLRVRPLAELPIAHEREHPRQVALVREHQQVVHQREMLLEGVGHARWQSDRRNLRTIASFGLLDPAFDLTHVVEIVVQTRLVARSERSLQIPRLSRDDVEDAARAGRTRLPLCRTARSTEQLL